MLFRRLYTGICMSLVFCFSISAGAETLDSFTNSIGMKFVNIRDGSFLMGQQEGGEFDERPVHNVNITGAFYIASMEVTNVQYEQFRPGFRKSSGKPEKLSNGDDDAVIFVSWSDAADFCNWLSKKEGKPYRLPTEAEWEYSCRAGSTTDYHKGFEPPKDPVKGEKNKKAKLSLKTGQKPANAWGLYDMHGNVEEWCLDWYGPYEKESQIDPVGRIDGDSRVIRGGSHSTKAAYLRSANRSGALPEDKHQLLGFRVVMGEMPKTKPFPKAEPKLCMQNVSQSKFDWKPKIDMSEPYFKGPVQYVIKPANPEAVPMFKHNHCPAITWCDNGDLFAVWFSCITEGGREMTILGSRLRAGSDSWDEPSEFYNVPDRNMTGSALVNDNKGRLYFLNGVSIATGYKTNNALLMRTSDDNGANWSKTRLINPKRGISSQPIGSGWCTDDGRIVVPSDWPWGKTNGGTALWISSDRGKTWSISQGPIAGIHASAVDLGKEKFLALGRLKGKDGSKMPMSISNNGGKTWDYSETEFPGVSGGQRLVLRKLQEGPLLLISFTSTRNSKKTMAIRDETGKERDVHGMFAALSFDEGKTWPVKKLITTGGPARQFDGGAWTNEFTMDDNNAEHAGYLSGIQTPDGVFHLISSALHYQFNLAWVKTPMPAETKNTSTIIK